MDSLLLNGIVNHLSNFEAEQAVLGALLLEKNLYYANADTLFDELFSTFSNQCVFKAIKEVVNSGTDIDLVTISQQMRNAGYNELIIREDDTWRGPGSIAALTSRIASTAHFESHVAILTVCWQLRKINKMSGEVSRQCMALEAPEEIISSINTQIVELTNINDKDFDKSSVLKSTIKNMEVESLENMLKSGIHALDNFIFGFEYIDFIVIAGAPSMGKTAFALRLYLNFILQGLNPAFFSLEMSEQQLVSRLISMYSNVSLSTIRKRSLMDSDWVNIHKAVGVLESHDFVIDDFTGDLNKIANKIRKYNIKHGSKIFFIDYLQLVDVKLGKGSTREREVATITRTFKELCRELKIIIFALSQLNREVGKRGNTRPQLGDLRESGAIEQDADMVLFPYRPAYYNTFETTIPYQEDATLIIGKGRGTGLGDIPLKFISTRTNYLNGDQEIKIDEQPF